MQGTQAEADPWHACLLLPRLRREQGVKQMQGALGQQYVQLITAADYDSHSGRTLLLLQPPCQS
jgi:hypothetical protein